VIASRPLPPGRPASPRGSGPCNNAVCRAVVATIRRAGLHTTEARQVKAQRFQIPHGSGPGVVIHDDPGSRSPVHNSRDQLGGLDGVVAGFLGQMGSQRPRDGDGVLRLRGWAGGSIESR
jgi:hypothetical protein